MDLVGGEGREGDGGHGGDVGFCAGAEVEGHFCGVVLGGWITGVEVTQLSMIEL